MARIVKHDRQRPYMLKKEDLKDSIAICACGLSQNKPFCDGSHRRTYDEEEGALYAYDNEGRIKLPIAYAPDPTS